MAKGIKVQHGQGEPRNEPCSMKRGDLTSLQKVLTEVLADLSRNFLPSTQSKGTKKRTELCEKDGLTHLQKVSIQVSLRRLVSVETFCHCSLFVSYQKDILPNDLINCYTI